ncbi:hypothetical protein MRB53_018180 [Persea americana]|uniref:Uncharacterized protein n=1 Tax=Persea americana TaxID=3435 RepID=A0ACC2M6R2_PERAE|nr:hypothetical protein MRB53_018180 [Persea americana]
MGKGLLPDTHELVAIAAWSLAIGRCDVALVVGAWLNWLLHSNAKENVQKIEVQLAKEVVPFNFFKLIKIIRDVILTEGSLVPILVSEGANTMDVGRAALLQMEQRSRLDARTWGDNGSCFGLLYCSCSDFA